jgi:signal transduction histidine kinase
MISAIAATTITTFSALRLLRPLEEVRRVARRLAGGSYHERAPIPEDEELAALATDVNALAEAVEKTEQRRLRLVSVVAHELRTPVATLKGYMEGLLDGIFQSDPETLAAGDPYWRTPNKDGSYPPPPHDSSDHTNHHSDQVPTEIPGTAPTFPYRGGPPSGTGSATTTLRPSSSSSRPVGAPKNGLTNNR